MESGCARPDCTVAETGICLLNHEPSSCPDRVVTAEAEAGVEVPRLRKTAFPGSRAFTLSEARGLMAERYAHLVGILGEPNAGKTGCLVSLYLSVGQRLLDGFSFADSRTLMGFEEISQGARRWNEGRIPEQITDHTELPDDRTAGFLHLRLARAKQASPVDLLCSDLPGEWTTALVDHNRVDRLGFLRRADVIWLVVDGTELVTQAKRQLCVFRTKLVIERLDQFLGCRPRLILVVTRRDREMPAEDVVQTICAEGTRRGFETESVAVASFSYDGVVAAGTGILALLQRTTAFGYDGGVVWQPDVSGALFDPQIGLVRRRTHEG